MPKGMNIKIFSKKYAWESSEELSVPNGSRSTPVRLPGSREKKARLKITTRYTVRKNSGHFLSFFPFPLVLPLLYNLRKSKNTAPANIPQGRYPKGSKKSFPICAANSANLSVIAKIRPSMNQLFPNRERAHPRRSSLLLRFSWDFPPSKARGRRCRTAVPVLL